MNPVWVHYAASSLIESLSFSTNGAFQAFTFVLDFNGPIKWKAHEAFFMSSSSTCCTQRMETMERQRGRKLRNAHLRRSANYEETSRVEEAEEAERMGLDAGRSSDLLPSAFARGGTVTCLIFVSSAVLLLWLCPTLILDVKSSHIKATHTDISISGRLRGWTDNEY